MRPSDAQLLRDLAKAVLPLLTAVCDGMKYTPGHSDLDDEQPISVRMSLGDYRKASMLKYDLEHGL